MYDFVRKQDPEVFVALDGEEKREAEGVELIPSENYVSKAVREANGSCLTNKYAEGYPGKRYYGGQEFTDAVETLAIERAKKLFNCSYANVQPHAGAPANIATYFALMEPGDTIMGMDLSHGGHLTHGHPVTYITKIFNFVRYKMKNIETGEIDYEEMLKVAKESKPKVILAGFSAYPRELDYAKFVEIGREVGAIAFGEALKPSFKVYAKQILKNAKAMEKVFKENNVRMITGGTSNHLILADVYGSLGVCGQEAEDLLDEVGITLNKNMIADDARKPMDPSGIRFGTPAITTRDFKEKESARVAELIVDTLKHRRDKKRHKETREEIRRLCKKFPIPESFV